MSILRWIFVSICLAAKNIRDEELPISFTVAPPTRKLFDDDDDDKPIIMKISESISNEPAHSAHVTLHKSNNNDISLSGYGDWELS